MMEKGSIWYRSEAKKSLEEDGRSATTKGVFVQERKRRKSFPTFFVVLVRSVAEEKPELAL